MTTPNRHQKIIKGIPETIVDTDPISPLHTKLKATDSQIQNYVIALEKENLKLKKTVDNLQEENASLHDRIRTFQEDLKKSIPREGGEIKTTTKVPHKKPPN